MPVLATVVIPVRGDRRISRALYALSRQTIARNAFDVIVVENGTRLFEATVRGSGATYLWLPEANTSRARNAGIRRAGGTIIACTDADCVPAETWIAELVKGFEDSPDVAAIGGRVDRYKPRTPVQQYGANLVNNQSALNYLPILPLPYVVTANCAFSRDALERVGGFDETLLSGADVDICYSLGLKGYTLALAPEAVVFHDNRATISGHFRRFFRYAVYQAALFRKYRNVAGRRGRFNTYPYRCWFQAGRHLYAAFSARGEERRSTAWAGLLLAVEGAGVLAGDMYGSLKFRVLYI